jgi:hypothetical protein
MYNIITIIALLALSTRQIEAQAVLATACYFKRDSQVGLGNAGPCGVVTPTTVRPPPPPNLRVNNR